jgi:hypothetical protein
MTMLKKILQVSFLLRIFFITSYRKNRNDMHINLDMAIYLQGSVGRGIVAHQMNMCTSYRMNTNDMHINLDMAIYLHLSIWKRHIGTSNQHVH